jgi:crotonobetainyl-CoA:carnitine CoA-transferase CaiB-like acyl-CoA transferase
MRVMKPLSGIRVLDFTRIVAGPTCSSALAAFGAEVIRVEAPGGDVTWNVPPFFGPGGVNRGKRGPRDIPLSPLRRGRGKRSVVIDVKHPEGADLFRRLAAVCDVLVENSVPGTMRKLGFDYATLEKLNPRLVYCTITGYGHTGPYRDRASMDMVVQAMSGIMAKTGFEDGPPTKVGVTVGDQVPGLYGALGVMAALRQRDLDGRGQLVDVAMYDALVALLWDEPLDEYEDQGIPQRVGNTDPRGAPLAVFQTLDGWVAIVVTSEKQWQEMARHMGRADLLERWSDRNARSAQRRQVNEEVEKWTRTRTTAQIMDLLLPLGMPCGPVQDAWAARRDPQIAHRGMLEPLRHPDVADPSPFLGPRLPVNLSRHERQLPPAEPLGTSTDAVLRECLGLDDAELARLHAGGVIHGC